MNKYLLYTFLFLFSFGVIYAQETDENSLKLLFLGDIMGHGPQIKSAYDDTTKTYNYDTTFKYIKNTFSKADFVIGNLEVTLGVKPYSGYPQFSSPPELANAIKNAGINILGTANNHSCDRRKKGIVNTIDVLDSLDIKHFGTYSSEVEKVSQNPLLIEKNDIKIALLNYTYGTNGIPVPLGTVVNLLDKNTISKDVAIAKALQPDEIIAFVHWGEQYVDLPMASQKSWFAYFKSLGVNIVIGSHPHVVEPMLWDKSDNSLVVYSLGNFVSNQRTFPRDGGAVFELTLTKKENQTKITSANYLLTWVQKRIENNKVDFIVLPVEEFEFKSAYFQNESDYLKMQKFSQHARKLLNKNNVDIPENKPFTNMLLYLSYLFI